MKILVKNIRLNEICEEYFVTNGTYKRLCPKLVNPIYFKSIDTQAKIIAPKKCFSVVAKTTTKITWSRLWVASKERKQP